MSEEHGQLTVMLLAVIAGALVGGWIGAVIGGVLAYFVVTG